MMSTNGSLATEFGKKSALLSKMSSSTSNSFSSSASEKMLKSSSTSSTSMTSKKAQIRHAVTSSSSAATCQELKQTQQQQQNELFQENRNFSRSVSVTSNASSCSDSRLKLMSCASSHDYSVEEPLSEEELGGDNQVASTGGQQALKFEQQSVTSSSKMKVSTSEGFTAEKAEITNQQRKKMSSGNISFEEATSTAALQEKLDVQGFSSEKISAVRQDQMQLKTADSIQQQQRTAMASSMKLSTDEFTSEKMAMAKQEEKRTFLQGMVQEEKNVSSTSSSKMTFTSKGISKTAMTTQNMHHIDLCDVSSTLGINLPSSTPFSTSANRHLAITQGLEEDLEILKGDSPDPDVQKVIERFNNRMVACVQNLKNTSGKEIQDLLDAMSKILKAAWAVPSYGHELGASMCNILLDNGALRILVDNCTSDDSEIRYKSAKVLEKCLSTQNRTYVVENGLEQVVKIACKCIMHQHPSRTKVGTGILQHLFKHSESTCSDVIRLGGLNSLLYSCRGSDIETLQHCATALANLSLYGGPENQQSMITHKVPVWLFPLAFHDDDNIKYYACLAISALVANKEIEAAVLRSGTLNLVEPFVTQHSPAEFAKSHVAHAHGQTKNWLQRLVNVLDSKREEARNLAAFHFAMEAGIKKKQGNTKVFNEIGAVEALKKVASSPNAIASKFAAQALRLIGEELPHKLSQQVPLWTAEDVAQWVQQIGFLAYCDEFSNSRVDGDLLLQLDEIMLKDDIGIKNGILRKRFLRELSQLKKMADYTSCDSTYLNQVLQGLGPEFSQYTYQMLHCGIQKETLRFISEEQLSEECGIHNSIHRLRIAQAIQGLCQHSENAEEEAINQKPLDVFVSYRRSNGSQLASLLKVHLQLRGFSVFIDVERLEAGKFDYNLLDSIRQAKHFLLVLTPNALERCVDDNECKDWVHKEIVEALQSQCNIIPILDNFQWPEAETLPEDMRAISYFNGVRWIHDYQDACVDKLERFLRGEMNVRSDGPLGRFASLSGSAGTPGTPGTISGSLPPAAPRSHHLYQRSISSESAKNGAGTASDEKDCCNGDRTERVNDTANNHFGV